MSTLGSLSEVSARVSRGRHTYRYVHVFLGGDLRTDVYRLLSCVFLHMYIYIYTHVNPQWHHHIIARLATASEGEGGLFVIFYLPT